MSRFFRVCRFAPVIALVIALGESICSAQQYTNLLQDKSLHHWTKPGGEPAGEGWTFDSDGSLHLSGKGGNIVTREDYGDFDLWFEYRISPKGNSGIKYRVRQYGQAWLGIEYQIQDDAAFPEMAPKHQTASLYDMIDQSSSILRRRYQPLDAYNVGRIVVQNHRLRHWMNGNIIIDESDCSPRFDDAIRKSKFRDQDGFGKNPLGKLMLTDHGTEVWYRNVYVRRLDACPPLP
ncbi:MAG: DUF1080 domain-containing protein [Planctomycetota bacterium]